MDSHSELELEDVGIKLEGDQDLMVAAKDFERIADSCYKVVINEHTLCTRTQYDTFFVSPCTEWVCGGCGGREG